MNDERKRFSPLAVILSGVLNLLLVVALLNEELVWLRQAQSVPREVEVDVVPERPKPPMAQPRAATPPPERPAIDHPPEPRPAVAPPKPLPPQLTPAPLAKRSASPHGPPAKGSEDKPAKTLREAGAGPSLSVLSRSPGNGRPAHGSGPQGPELSQSEQDFILSQIVKYWHVDTHVPEAQGLVLEARIMIQADGTLASPLNKDDPWNPAAVITGYAALAQAGYSFRREAIEAFLLALRLSQPLKLPSAGPWPRSMVLRFAFDDM